MKESFWSLCSCRKRRVADEDPDKLYIESMEYKQIRFYMSNIYSIEIIHHKQLTRLLFRLPPMCQFLTTQSRTMLAVDMNRGSH